MFNFYLSKKRPFNDSIDVKIVTLLGFLNSVFLSHASLHKGGIFYHHC